MCGIVGYIGNKKSNDVILNGLSRLEYRGYDSAGIAVLDNGILQIKTAGKVADLIEVCNDENLHLIRKSKYCDLSSHQTDY